MLEQRSRFGRELHFDRLAAEVKGDETIATPK